MRNNVAIIILNYNNASDTINCIRSIREHNSASIKIIVVDNGSTNSNSACEIESFLRSSSYTFKIIKDTDPFMAELPDSVLIISESNDGYARGNNKGLQFAYNDDSIEDILILNNDTIFVEDIIPGLLQRREYLKDCAFITPILLTKEGHIDHTCARLEPSIWDVIIPFLTFKRDFFKCLTRIKKKNKVLLQNPGLMDSDSFPVHMPSGSCMLIKKALFKQLGGFDPNTFLYYEENILAKKIEAAGLRNYCIPSLKCIHLGAGSTSHSSGSFLQRCNLESANYYLTGFRHMTFLQKIVWGLCKSAWHLKWLIYR